MLKLSPLTTKDTWVELCQIAPSRALFSGAQAGPLENNTIIQSSLNLRGRMGLTITVKRIWVPPGAPGAASSSTWGFRFSSTSCARLAAGERGVRQVPLLRGCPNCRLHTREFW
jgi:hypothetical protein